MLAKKLDIPIKLIERPTACVTRRWAGWNETALTESVRAQNQLLLAERIPPVGCTLCWAPYLLEPILHFLARPYFKKQTINRQR